MKRDHDQPKTQTKARVPTEFKHDTMPLALTSDKSRAVMAQELGVGFGTLTKRLEQPAPGRQSLRSAL
jgi:hypothetical protein